MKDSSEQKNLMKKFKHVKLLNRMIKDRFVNVQSHPTLPLNIYNYSQSCQFEKMWNVVTMECRGLILDIDYNIVARPLKKFFNAEEIGINEVNEKMLNMSYNIFNKDDGSLGILYHHQNEYGIATRGSFTSDQATWATTFINEHYSDELKKLNTDEFTYLFELVYPENRIVIDYHGESKLIAITKIEKSTGVSIWDFCEFKQEMNGLNFETVKQIPIATHTDFDSLKLKDIENEEGYVLQFFDDYRIKIKFETYVKIHRVATNVTARAIWDVLRKNENLNELLEYAPDELFDWIENKAKELKTDHDEIMKNAKETYKLIVFNMKEGFTQKDFALQVQEFVDSTSTRGFIFSLHQNKDITDGVWSLLRPEHEKPFEKYANNIQK